MLFRSPMKSVMRFGRKGKLSPRFVGPFEILERVGTLAYKVALPPSLSKIHNVFHISTLRKYVTPQNLLQGHDDHFIPLAQRLKVETI